jgi:hypothetical protein
MTFFDAAIEWLDPDISDRAGDWSAMVTPHGNVLLSGHDGAQEVMIIFTVTSSTIAVMLAHCEVGKTLKSVATSGDASDRARRHIAETLNERLAEIIPPVAAPVRRPVAAPMRRPPPPRR